LKNRVLIIFGPERDEVTGEWRKLHNEELNDLYCSLNVIQVIKLRSLRRERHVARMGERRGVFRVLVRKPEGKTPLGRPRSWEDKYEDGSAGSEMWGAWTGLIWRGIGQVAGTYECGNEPSGSIKCGEFLDCLRRTLCHGLSKCVDSTGGIIQAVSSCHVLISSSFKPVSFRRWCCESCNCWELLHQLSVLIIIIVVLKPL
jgi:hypothetical protein